MATNDAGPTTLRDFDLEPNVVANDHTPTLYPRERFVRCTTCGVTAPFSVTAEGPIRRALGELATISCGEYDLPDVEVGNHVPTVTPEHPTYGRIVVCESCGRRAPLQGDQEAVLRDLSAIPCIDQLSYTELVDLVIAPTTFTPLFPDLGIANWYGRTGQMPDDDIIRVFRHDRFQCTAYIHANSDGSYTAAVTPAPDLRTESWDELDFPSTDPGDPATRETAVTFVTFLAATDSLRAGEIQELKATYDEAYQRHRSEWLDDAYATARERFITRFGDTPEAFETAFFDSSDKTPEILRRMITSGGFDDSDEDTFAREMLGHPLEFPGFIPYVADQYPWEPPVPDSPAPDQE